MRTTPSLPRTMWSMEKIFLANSQSSHVMLPWQPLLRMHKTWCSQRLSQKFVLKSSPHFLRFAHAYSRGCQGNMTLDLCEFPRKTFSILCMVLGMECLACIFTPLHCYWLVREVNRYVR